MTTTESTRSDLRDSWRALFALLFGFFMILVDSTIVTVATPALMQELDADINAVVWVTSAFLLAYATPLLITGRLGDRFGPKRVYLVGLVVFTLASLWRGLTSDIGGLIAARVLQGLGAALLSPQTMTIITRIFPAERRGAAMGAWGATAGVATLVGPILGGVLIDSLGWEWIFFVNVPVGLLAFVLAWKSVPDLSVQSHRFDLLGVALSAIGMFLLVFGIQEGQKYSWGTITGIVSVPALIGGGLLVLVAFVVWQRFNRAEPLVPLGLFADRNYGLANIAIATVGFAITAMAFPIMVWAQQVRGWSPTQAALLLAPMAVLTAVLAPFVGRMVDRLHPRLLAGFGLVTFAVALAGLGAILDRDTSVWLLMVPIALLGVANGFMWSPLSVTATRTLPPQRAGAGSGVYNTTRQVGAVLGSAAIAVLMESRIAANSTSFGWFSYGRSPEPTTGPTTGPTTEQMQQSMHGYARAMGESLYLPSAVVLIGLVAVMFFRNPHDRKAREADRA